MSNTILVVEDDAGLREALIDTLEMSGIACMAANSAEQAMVLLKKDAFSLISYRCARRNQRGFNRGALSPGCP